MELGVELVDILLHAALGEKEFFCDLAVAEPRGDERSELALPIRECGKCSCTVRKQATENKR